EIRSQESFRNAERGKPKADGNPRQLKWIAGLKSYPTNLQLCGAGRREAARRSVGPRCARPLSCALNAFEELFCRQPDVLRDLTQQGRRDVPPGVKWKRRPATVWMAELLVGASLANFGEAQALQKGHDLTWFECGQRAHYATLIVWTATNSDSNLGSPSSRSMLTTSCRLACSSSSDSPWLWAPGHPGTWLTNTPV